jgi:hypothetical protein
MAVHQIIFEAITGLTVGFSPPASLQAREKSQEVEDEE